MARQKKGARVICPTCGGDVTVPLTAMTVGLCLDGDLTYSFSCPECGVPGVREADGRQVDALLQAGVRFVVFEQPAELRERRPSGPAFTDADMRAFHEGLDGDWQGALRRDSEGV